MYCPKYFCILLLLTIMLSCKWEAPEEVEIAMAALPEQIDFNYHVKPILSDKCFACHGPDAKNQESDLRLDLESYAFKALNESKHAFAIVKGKPGKSELIHRIFSEEESLQMPPPSSNLFLSTEEKATLTKWIKQGAEYKPHWSFIPPSSSLPPGHSTHDDKEHPIDVFVRKKLKEEKLSPSPKAEKETLIRRLFFDLTGLPPTLEKIDHFLSAEHDERAYEKLVDSLLASPAYGERMAADWMDVARYADSDGYLDDKHRDFSPYRDWVIEAFNDNMPYEQFITWQLAGDLIPNANKESILATAFNRLHKRNSEAGIVFEEYRQEYVADRTMTVGKAMMGLSMECARCHDHKYDPITQKNYFEMAAFFNSTNELGTAVYGPGQVPGPSLLLTDENQEKLLAYLDSSIVQANADVKGRKETIKKENVDKIEAFIKNKPGALSSLKGGIAESEVVNYSFDDCKADKEGTNYQNFSTGRITAPVTISEPDINSGKSGKAIFINDFTTLKLPEKVGWYDQTDPFSVSISLYPDTVYKEAVIFTHCEDIRLGLKGYSLHLEENKLNFIMAFSWPSNAIQVKSKKPLPIREWSDIAVTYDGSGNAEGLVLYLNGKEIATETVADNLYKSILFEPDIHTYGFRGFSLGVRDKMKTFLKGGLDELALFSRELSPWEVMYLHSPKKAEQLLEDQKSSTVLTEHFINRKDPFLKEKKKHLLALRKEQTKVLDEIQEIMVMGDLPEPRPTFVLDRGLYSSPTEEVFPNVPEMVLPYSEEYPKNRLGLSKWLFDERNPLTARVFVNRLWQMHFGRGLVGSSDDFGNQGDLPSHPELLDWLAITFKETGWDVKAMHKLILMSETYQQSSKANSALLEKDPENLLLARGPSYRMTAEMVRDYALAISGLLSRKIGGPSAYPYQPEGLWDELSTKSWRYRYKKETGEGLYRRSLYTIWKRTSGPPSMMIFDVGDRAECNVRRRQTSTPLQALVLLNDPQYVEAARVLAEALIHKQPGEKDKQLIDAYRSATGRHPDNEEMDILLQFYEEEYENFENNKENAIAYLHTGSRARDPGLEAIEVAALATVINGIMNTTDGYTIR
ncbi:DUF1553 domain-containing protein [Pleomorphovibrio marinus]|uniref:DUF1553 domain-containing protein n=1 Tax=Pleomorphovibrio marinus TaxID=2164132 RepID=UPI000E0BB63C|nr:DUF1553 domain-containing protein [Pleomorphovibrio marinus]